MLRTFLRLQYKQFFRSHYWQKSLTLNILLGFFALYMLVSFLTLGFAVYPLLKKQFPDKDPFLIINKLLIYAVLIDLIIRYFLQNVPKMSVKPFFILPVRRTQITRYILTKSAVSFFNFLPMVFYTPFAIMLLIKGYDAFGVIIWWLVMLFITLTINYLNIIINKNGRVFIGVLFTLILLLVSQYSGWFDLTAIFGKIFYGFYQQPALGLVPVVLFLLVYYGAYKTIKRQLYLDLMGDKKQFAADDGLTWLDRFGQKSIFLRNDIRLIRRNKRPRMVFLMSFIMLLYGLLFFTNPVYMKKMSFFLVFVVLFITGGFTMNFGQFIPAWDSKYFNFLMSQNFKYRDYLEAKWMMMSIMTVLLFVLSTPYLYFGKQIFLLLLVGAIFNLGFTSYLVLFLGAYNRKAIDLDRSAMMNYQGTSAMQFLMVFIVMAFPMIIYAVVNHYFGFNTALAVIFTIGVAGLLLKKQIMNFIEKKYIQNKYKTITAFKKD